MIGKIEKLSIDGGKIHLTLELDEDIENCLPKLGDLRGKTLSIEIARYGRKRTVKANRFYWKHLTLLARLLHVSIPHAHNLILRRYGVSEGLYTYLPDTPEEERRIDEWETVHLKPTSAIITDKRGQSRRGYLILRGSSSYTTVEFAALCDGLIDELRQMGVEVEDRETREMLEKMKKRRDMDGNGLR